MKWYVTVTPLAQEDFGVTVTARRNSLNESQTPVREQDKLMLRLPDGMRERIKQAAAEHKRSMNAEIVSILEEVSTLRSTSETLMHIIYEHQKREAHLQEQLSAFNTEIPKIPDALHRRIESSARQHGRSYFEELVQGLESAFPPPPNANELLKWMSTFRGAQPIPGYEKEFYDNLALVRRLIHESDDSTS